MPAPASVTRALTVGAAAVLVACGGAGGGRTAADPPPPACSSPTPVDRAGAIPKSLPLTEWGTIVRVEERAGYVGAEVVGNGLIVELYPEIVRTLTANRYTLLGGDNEGFEAEISFLDPKENYLNLVIRQGSCEGEIRMRVLIEDKKTS